MACTVHPVQPTAADGVSGRTRGGAQVSREHCTVRMISWWMGMAFLWGGAPAVAQVDGASGGAPADGCPGDQGDADGNGQLDIVDVQCALLLALYETTEVGAELPACADEVRMHRCAYDLDCSGGTDVVDVSLFIQRALGMPLSPQIDTDGDGCHDGCAQGCPWTPFEALEAVDATAPEPEPYDPNAQDEDLPWPADEPTSWPGAAWLEPYLEAVTATGVEVQLDYTAEGVPKVLNVVEAIAPEDVVSTEVGTYAWVDVGDLQVVVTDVPLSLPGADALLVLGSTPLEEVSVVATYQATVDAAGNASVGLAAISAVQVGQSGVLPVTPLDVVGWIAPSANHHDCVADAWVEAGEVAGLAVQFPKLKACDYDQCVAVRAAWIRAWHDIGRLVEMVDFLDGLDGELRAWAWSQPGVAPDGHTLGADTSLAFYFGSYTPHRFDAIRWALHRLRDRFHQRKVQAIALSLRCTPLPGDLCETANPGANHAVVGRIVMCDRWFDELGPEDRARNLVHEMAHHMYVPLTYDTKPPVTLSVAVMDTHTHHHGSGCAKLKSRKDYGLDNVRHLATYLNSKGKGCWHRNLALRNNDTYGFAVHAIGAAVRLGIMQRWPASLYPPDWMPGGPANVPSCQGAVWTPPPPQGWGGYDPLGGCHKEGTELVCPPPAGGSGGGVLGPVEISALCPTQP